MNAPAETRTAVVFPGMGPTGFADVAKFMLVDPFARGLLAEADRVLGYSLVDRYAEEERDYSVSAQLAMLVNCLALAEWAGEHLGLAPDFCTGPSFGEKAAAVHSGALGFPEALWLTGELARREERYFARAHQDVVTQSLARTPRSVLEEILGELDDRGEWHEMSCYVDDSFHMVSLRKDALDWFRQRVRAGGGMALYTMWPPLHSSAFAELRDEVASEVLSEVSFRDPVVPVVADQDGTVLRTGDGVRRMLLDGYVRPVRWPDVVSALRGFGVGRVYVAGPDRLFGRVGVTTANFEVVAVDPRRALRPRRRRTAG
ncbi:ACP S-malonyltransferase [Amycolatopsis samaneae]